MSKNDYTTLRREFLGVGLTGAMVGLAGCSDSLPIETESDNESTESPDIDTAEFSFSYDGEAKQTQIEFTGGAAIDAGNVQIQHNAGREVLWAELGSTTAGPEEDIEAGAVAVLGPEILNWEAPIERGETLRLIYTGKETPTTLERYTPPGETGTGTTSDTNTGTVVVDDFENTEQLDWRINHGDRSRLEFSEDSAQGDYSLYFRDASSNPTNISRSLDNGQMGTV